MREVEPLDLAAYRESKRVVHPFYKELTPEEQEGYQDAKANQLNFALWKRGQSMQTIDRGNTLYVYDQPPYDKNHGLKVDAQFVRGMNRAIFSLYEDLAETGAEGQGLADLVVMDNKERDR